MKMNDLPGTIVWPDLVWGECGQDHMHPSHHHQIPGLLLPVVVYTPVSTLTAIAYVVSSSGSVACCPYKKCRSRSF